MTADCCAVNIISYHICYVCTIITSGTPTSLFDICNQSHEAPSTQRWWNLPQTPLQVGCWRASVALASLHLRHQPWKDCKNCWKHAGNRKLDIHMRGRVAIWDNDHSGIGDDQDTTTRNRHDKTLHRKNFLLYPCWKDSIASIYGSPQKFPKWIVLCKLQEVVKLYYSAKLEPWWKSWMPPPQLSHFELNFGRPSSTRRASTILRMPDKLVYLESSFAGFVCRKCWSNEKTYWIWGSLTWEPKEVHLSCQDVLWPSMVRHVPLTYRDASRHSRLQCCGRSGCDASARDLSHCVAMAVCSS